MEVIQKNKWDWLKNPIRLPPHPTGARRTDVEDARCRLLAIAGFRGLAVASSLPKASNLSR
jgi:hypothetical protein